MASLFRLSLKSFRSPFFLSSKINKDPLPSQQPLLPKLTQIWSYGSKTLARSPFDSNIMRILRTEIDYQTEYAPSDAPRTSFNFFSVEDRPGEQFIRLKRKFGEAEDVRVEATMIDGCVSHPKARDDTDGENICFHISLLVDIYKGEGSDGLGFVCSAWPDGLEIMKVYLLHGNQTLPKAHIGPDVRKLDPKLRKALHEYLKARGVDDELSVFLHQFMVNKDRIEYLRWLENVKSFVGL